MSGKVVLYFYIVILAVLVYYRIIIAEMYIQCLSPAKNKQKKDQGDNKKAIF